MKQRKLVSVLLTAALLCSLTACGETDDGKKTAADGDGTAKTEGAATTSAQGDAQTTEGTAGNATSLSGTDFGYSVTDNAGTIKWLGYYDLYDDQEAIGALFDSRYHGTIESEICSSGAGYFERLGVLVSSDDAPDLVRYEWRSFPYGMSQNLYTALDDYINLDSELWSGIKSVADSYLYGGKHYYIPHEVSCSFALNYNKLVLENEGINDPMELYLSGDWNWDTFKDILTEWCNLGEDYIGYTGVGAMSFVETTGTKVVEITNDGQILNNMKSPSIQRCMDFLEELAKQGMVGEGYVSPQEAFVDGKTLFLGMEPTWCFKAAKEQLFKSNIDEDMAFIPFPKDPQADEYYIATDNFGYMVPAGAKNIDGAVAWITLCRDYKTDEEIVAADRATATDPTPAYFAKCPECKYNYSQEGSEDLTTCPECGTARKQKFKAVYTEEQYNVLDDLKDPTKFHLLFDNVFGFDDTFNNLFTGGSAEAPSLLDSPLFHGASYTQLRETIYGTVETYLDPYRVKLAEAMAS